MLARMQRLYTRDEYLRRIEWMKRARRNISITTDIIVGFPGETDADLQQTLDLLDEVEYDSLFGFKYSKRPNTSALGLDEHIEEEEKIRRLAIVQEKQRAIQIRRNGELVGSIEETMVEGFNKATGQWIGRTSQNRTLNFTHAAIPNLESDGEFVGKYLSVRVTRAGPNSLAGEAIVQ
jgi:tRNA-2-methylthio-N6-dimethylallyladenosine synthase